VAYLLDTNLLLRWANLLDPARPLALSALRTLRRRGDLLHTTPQNYIEFWSSATRPVAVNGLGLTPDQAYRLIQRLRPLFPLLADTDRVFDEWLRVVVTTGVSGRQVHDARLAAVMLAHGVSHILTFNVADFTRYQSLGIVPIHPTSV
jgi:predicted nucleic acid-binding protein